MLFESMAKSEDELSEETLRRNASIIAYQRSLKQFGAYVAKSRNSIEKQARLNMLDDKLRTVVHEACLEAGYANSEVVFNDIQAKLAGDVNEGDSSQKDTVDITKPIGDKSDSVAGAHGQSAKPKGEVNPPSKVHPKTEQNIEQKAEYDGFDWDRHNVTEAPTKEVDIEEPIGNTQAIHTDTFSDKGVNANPVTSKWHVIAEVPQGLPTEAEMPVAPQTAGMDLDTLAQMVMQIGADVKKIQSEISGANEDLDQMGGSPESVGHSPEVPEQQQGY